MLGRVFKAYDIRGTYPDLLTDRMGWQIGCGSARYLLEDAENDGESTPMMRNVSWANVGAVWHSKQRVAPERNNSKPRLWAGVRASKSPFAYLSKALSLLTSVRWKAARAFVTFSAEMLSSP